MGENKIISHFDVSASALTAERVRMRLISSNIANVHTTRSPEGGPFQKKLALLQSKSMDGSAINTGVGIAKIATDSSAPKLVYDPAHPDADKGGYVAYPNVDLIKEVADMKTATMAYQANLTMIKGSKQMITGALSIAE